MPLKKMVVVTAADGAARLGYNVEYFRQIARKHKIGALPVGKYYTYMYSWHDAITKLRAAGLIDVLQYMDQLEELRLAGDCLAAPGASSASGAAETDEAKAGGGDL